MVRRKFINSTMSSTRVRSFCVASVNISLKTNQFVALLYEAPTKPDCYSWPVVCILKSISEYFINNFTTHWNNGSNELGQNYGAPVHFSFMRQSSLNCMPPGKFYQHKVATGCQRCTFRDQRNPAVEDSDVSEGKGQIARTKYLFIIDS